MISPEAVGGLALLALLAVLSLALGVYLVTTNPPKDDRKFLGVGAEKLTDEELAEREADRAQAADDRDG